LAVVVGLGQAAEEQEAVNTLHWAGHSRSTDPDPDVGNVGVAFSSPPQLIQGGVVDSECT
jgi:hypothetical protein